MIAKVYKNSTTTEIKEGFGEYFFGDITGSYQVESKDLDYLDREITKIKTIYEVTPLPYKVCGVVDKYVDALNVELNWHFPKGSIHSRMLDKDNYLSDFKLDLIKQGKI
jgi:hypothetical protein